MNVEVTVTVTVEAGKGRRWNFLAFDALRHVGSEISMNPEYVEQKGDGSNFTFEYQVKGIKGIGE